MHGIQFGIKYKYQHLDTQYQFINPQDNIVTMFTMFTLCLVFSLISSISCAGPPSYGAAPSYEKEVPQPYQYQYGVQDDYSGTNFAASENSDSKVVTGTYTVHLPDGRIQTVKYTADHYNGYVADVTYEGTPVYPEAKPYAPAPKYAPAPPKYGHA